MKQHTPFEDGRKVRRLVAGNVPAKVLDELPECIERFEINTPARLAHFMAQCGHESGGFRVVVENLNYSAQGLRAVFPRHFTEAEAVAYARQPERIANRVYANRMGNGDEASGDGWYRRGRGYIQLTGTQNQQAFFKAMGLPVDSDPAMISEVYPLQSAGWFWKWRKLNGVADTGSVRDVTRVVNGGFNGLADREKRYHVFLALLLPDINREIKKEV